jgi:hypothetical protein
MWSAAHLLLFKLHLPGRYSQWPVRLLIVTAAAIALGRMWDAAQQARFARVAIVIGAAVLGILPHLSNDLPNHSYVRGKPRELFEFLRAQPKEAVIASLGAEAGAIPVFAQRSVLASAEHAIPYHVGYYRELRQRGVDLLHAHLTSDPTELREFIEKYGVDFFIIARQPLTVRELNGRQWYKDLAPPEAFAALDRGAQPALPTFAERCKVWENETLIVLDARAIAAATAAR